MPTIRVFHSGDRVLATEHRRDETYTDANRPEPYTAADWFTADSALLSDPEGVIPFESLRVSGPAGRPGLTVDTAEMNRRRQAIKDRTRGAGGRLDQLEAKLVDDSITDRERNELMRLERGLE